METGAQRDELRFGPFVVDLSSLQLRKNGIRIKLPRQSFLILRVLLEHPGEIVRREELHRLLWPADTFVDFDHGLNNAVQRIRLALGDPAENPRYIETLPTLGYRFISGNGVSAVPIPAIEPVTPDHKSESSPRPQRRWLLSALVGAALLCGCAGVIAYLWRPASAVPIKSLAVLPLENLSGDPAQEYFADGMTDEVITMLARNPALRVISRTSVMQYKKVHRPLREIARELGVDGILEGSVERSGNRVHLTAQLIHAASDTHVWAESFDRDLSDVTRLQNELAETVARKVGTAALVSRKPEHRINAEAHDAYLLGRYYWFAGQTEKSRVYFQKAIDLQQDYAAAWSGLSDVYGAMGVTGQYPPEMVMPKKEAAARKAVELDDSLAEAHNSMAGFYLFYQWNWQAAETESARAVDLNPNYAEGHHIRGCVLRALNRMDEASREAKNVIALDPFARPDSLGFALLHARQFDAALNEARLRTEAQPNDADIHYLLSYAYFYKGMEKESEEESERYLQLAGEKDRLAEQVQVYRHGGFRAVLKWRADELQRRATQQYVSPIDLAYAYAELGRKEETIRYLEQSYRERAPHLVFLQSDPSFDFVHSDPRYRAIVNKMGLPPAYDPPAL